MAIDPELRPVGIEVESVLTESPTLVNEARSPCGAPGLSLAGSNDRQRSALW
jgi:hypothetical protein